MRSFTVLFNLVSAFVLVSTIEAFFVSEKISFDPYINNMATTRVKKREALIKMTSNNNNNNNYENRHTFLTKVLTSSTILLSASFLPKQTTKSLPFNLSVSSEKVNAMVDAPDLLDIPIQYEGKDVLLKDRLGSKATLIVNVASSCALTDGSYKGLVSLYKDYENQGLEILAFPCNQFGFQEPDEESFIRKDIKKRYGVNFALYDKIDVNGPTAHPLYKAIKKYEPELSGYGDKIAWNFEKFLVDDKGKVVRRYRPGVKPESIIPDVKTLIEKGKLGPARKRSLNEYD